MPNGLQRWQRLARDAPAQVSTVGRAYWTVTERWYAHSLLVPPTHGWL